MKESEQQIVRLTCPHNCYGTCGMLATVQDGRLVKIDGDPDHPYTQGRLCAKGYSYVDRIYAPDRLRHPMRQSPRGSGRWQRLSWEDALSIIADRLIDIYRRHGSLLPLCHYRISGSMGAFQAAPHALFRSIGPVTRVENLLCWAAGLEAQRLDFGDNRAHDPLQMQEAKLLIIWGGNPAWTASHQMRLILEAQDRGTKVVVIDPLLTSTATRADWHIAPRVGSDGALALGMARAILEAGCQDEAFLAAHVTGWPEFRQYLEREVSLEWAATETGIAPAEIRALALAYAKEQPAMIWIGYGLQRHQNAGQTVRAIDALAAITGQIGKPGTGVQFAQLQTLCLEQSLYTYDRRPDQPDRVIPSGAIGQTLTNLTGPPVEALWVSSANPAVQEPQSAQVREALAAIPFLVVVDQFMTKTAALADLVLPASTFAEQWDLHASYWHPYLSVSQRAIPPLFESRSDLQIAWMLAEAINRRQPGLAAFPSEGDEQAWSQAAWEALPPSLTDGASFDQLLAGPIRANLPATAWEELRFATPSGRYELWSEVAVARGLPALPIHQESAKVPEGYPYRLLTPHTVESLHSQFHGAALGLRSRPRPVVELHPDLAAQLGVREGQLLRLHNPQGELHLPARLTRNVPTGLLVAYETFYPDLAYNVNELTSAVPGPLPGEGSFPGVHYHDCFVAVEPSGRRGG